MPRSLSPLALLLAACAGPAATGGPAPREAAPVPPPGAGVIPATSDALAGTLAGAVGEGLRPPGSSGRVLVHLVSDPAGAVVLVDGELVCRDTSKPCAKLLTPGPHEIAMLKERHARRAQRVDVRGPAMIEWRLEPSFAPIEVRSTPPGLELTVGEEVVGRTPWVGELEAGAAVLGIFDRCLVPWSGEVQLERGQKRVVEVTLPPRLVDLELRVVDANGGSTSAEVLVDGQPAGAAPGHFRVPTCAKTIEARNPELGSWRRALDFGDVRAATAEAKLAGPVAPAQRPVPHFDNAALAPLKGRKAWVQVPGPADAWYCDVLARAGLDVTCDTNNADQELYDLIVRCPNLPQDTFARVERFLGFASQPRRYDWRSENACGQYHEITIEVPLAASAARGVKGPADLGLPAGPRFDPAAMAGIRGRKAWVQVPGPADAWWCDQIRQAGLEVTCDTNNADQELYDLIVRCPDLPSDTFAQVERFLQLGTAPRRYDWRSERKCQQYHEITIEIPLAASAARGIRGPSDLPNALEKLELLPASGRPGSPEPEPQPTATCNCPCPQGPPPTVK